LHPADSGAVVAEQRNPFFGKAAPDMFHHEPEKDQSREFEV
jgi:hypothetical protein